MFPYEYKLSSWIPGLLLKCFDGKNARAYWATTCEIRNSVLQQCLNCTKAVVGSR